MSTPDVERTSLVERRNVRRPMAVRTTVLAVLAGNPPAVDACRGPDQPFQERAVAATPGAAAGTMSSRRPLRLPRGSHPARRAAYPPEKRAFGSSPGCSGRTVRVGRLPANPGGRPGRRPGRPPSGVVRPDDGGSFPDAPGRLCGHAGQTKHRWPLRRQAVLFCSYSLKMIADGFLRPIALRPVRLITGACATATVRVRTVRLSGKLVACRMTGGLRPALRELSLDHYCPSRPNRRIRNNGCFVAGRQPLRRNRPEKRWLDHFSTLWRSFCRALRETHTRFGAHRV